MPYRRRTSSKLWPCSLSKLQLQTMPFGSLAYLPNLAQHWSIYVQVGRRKAQRVMMEVELLRLLPPSTRLHPRLLAHQVINLRHNLGVRPVRQCGTTSPVLRGSPCRLELLHSPFMPDISPRYLSNHTCFEFSSIAPLLIPRSSLCSSISIGCAKLLLVSKRKEPLWQTDRLRQSRMGGCSIAPEGETQRGMRRHLLTLNHLDSRSTALIFTV